MATRPAAMDTTTMHNDSPMDHMQGEMYIHKVKRDDVMDLVEELQEYRNDLANQGSASILTQRKCRDSLTSMDLRHRHWYTLLCGRWDILVTSLGTPPTRPPNLETSNNSEFVTHRKLSVRYLKHAQHFSKFHWYKQFDRHPRKFWWVANLG